MPGATTIAQDIRARNPGAYDDLSDQDLEALALAKNPDKYKGLARTPAAPATPAGRDATGDVPFLPDWANDAGKSWVAAGPSRVKEGLGDVMGGNIMRGAHDVVGGAVTTALPMLAGSLGRSVIKAPVATLAKTGAAVAGATAGDVTAESLAEYLGGDEDTQALAGDAGALVGGYAGIKLPQAVADLAGRYGPSVRSVAAKAAGLADHIPTWMKREAVVRALNLKGIPSIAGRKAAERLFPNAKADAAAPAPAAPSGPPAPQPPAVRTGTAFAPGEMPAATVPRGTSEAAAPVRAYHGSPSEFQQFDVAKSGSATDAGWLGKGGYFSTDARVAEKSAHQYAAEIGLKNPLRLKMPDWKTDKKSVVRDALGLPKASTAEEVTAAARAKGHDGVVLDYSPAGYMHQEIAVFDNAAVRGLTKTGGAAQPVSPATAAAPAKVRFAHGDPDAPAWLMKDAKPGDFRALSPQAIQNEVAVTARRAGVRLNPEQAQKAEALVRGGQEPVAAVREVAALDAQAQLAKMPGVVTPAAARAEVESRPWHIQGRRRTTP